MATMEELYDGIGALVKEATGRSWWRKDGIQSPPEGVYATIFLSEHNGMEKDIVTTVELGAPLSTGETFKQTPWGTALLSCEIEFFRTAKNDSARDAAMRLKLSLSLEKRFWDLWLLCSPSGAVRFLDFSTMFRADIEPRTRLTFGLISNIDGPEPLTGADIHEIEKTDITITEKLFDESVEGTEIIEIDVNV